MTALIAIAGLSKDYPSVRALDHVDFRLEAGEVHALLGHNGAGKSTLVKIIAGDQRGEATRFEVCGHHGMFDSPAAAIRCGVRIVTQERALVPGLSVEENILLGSYPVRPGGRVDWPAMRTRARTLLGELGLSLDPGELVARLRPAEQAGVEIAKALSQQARVLILDEPTATLSEHESQRLFAVVRELTARGVGVVLVSHRVPDIQALADRATVLRDGRVIVSAELGALPPDVLVREMSGDHATTTVSDPPSVRPVDGRAAFQATNVRVPGRLEDVSLEIRPGEIVGVFGLVGSGATDVPQALVGGMRRLGSIHLRGASVRSPRHARCLGIGLVPADRSDGVLRVQSVRRNLGVSNLGAYRRFGVYSRRREREATAAWIDRLGIRPRDPEALAAALSGGNQQKMLLGRWLERGSDILLLAEPTRGVDVGTRAAIHELLRQLRAAGTGILLASSDLDEVVEISDRILVLSRGRIVAEFAGHPSERERVMHAAAA